MKSFVLVTIMFFSCLAFASPNVGDKAVYEGVYGGRPFEQISELVEYNAPKDKFKQVDLIHYEGGSQIEEYWLPSDELKSKVELDYLIENCESKTDGILETISVLAGTFETCKFQDSKSVINFGKVPFGYVFVNTDKGAGWSLELKDYTWGKKH